MLAILDRAPMRAAHHRIWLLSTGGTMLGGFSVFTLGVAFPLLVRHFAIDATLEGLIGAALLLGAVPGSALGGPLADRLGRKPLMIVDMAIIATGALLCVFASDATMLLIGLFVLGIGVGIDYPVSST
jgi:putative MFS transporter